ncbi:hypothetical protein [Mesorhizobium sp. A623]
MNVHVLDAYRPGYGLPRNFYTSDEIFAAEQEKSSATAGSSPATRSNWRIPATT